MDHHFHNLDQQMDHMKELVSSLDQMLDRMVKWKKHQVHMDGQFGEFGPHSSPSPWFSLSFGWDGGDGGDGGSIRLTWAIW